MSSFLRLEALERKQKVSLNAFRTRIFLLLRSLIHLELKRQIRLYASVVPSKIIPVFRPKRNKKAKTLTFGAAHTYMAYIGKYPTQSPSPPHHSPSWAIVLQK